MSICRSCGAGITWAKTAQGRSMPVDRDPVPDGNITLEDTDIGTSIATVHGPDDPIEGERYVSHFATCPNANEHRRKQ